MTHSKIDWDKIKPIPGFDCVAEKNRIQAIIYEETKGMTPEEIREHTRKSAEEFRRKIEAIRKRNAETEGGDDR